MLKADLHIHTVASGHGYATLTENLEAASKKGMELIAVTDHGPHVPQGAHAWYFADLKVTPSFYKGTRLLHGCEANLVDSGTENGLDLEDWLLETLDFVSVGLHSCCGFSESDGKKNTDAMVRAMESPFVDQVNHPGNSLFPLEIESVVEAARKYDVIIELNEHSFDEHGSRAGSSSREVEFAQAAFEAGVPMAIGSDSHYFNTIGVFDRALEAAQKVGIPPEYFLNNSAERVLAHLNAKRERPRIDWGPVII
ncbi:MAG: PHP domain-containing protein [Coriobacteriia bacterium]|nr:PHP domain-containing protein [Coriobacteriia bacterium]